MFVSVQQTRFLTRSVCLCGTNQDFFDFFFTCCVCLCGTNQDFFYIFFYMLHLSMCNKPGFLTGSVCLCGKNHRKHGIQTSHLLNPANLWTVACPCRIFHYLLLSLYVADCLLLCDVFTSVIHAKSFTLARSHNVCSLTAFDRFIDDMMRKFSW